MRILIGRRRNVITGTGKSGISRTGTTNMAAMTGTGNLNRQGSR